MPQEFKLYFAVTVLVMSLVTFGTYWWDKRQAKLDGWRIPEKTLHMLAVFGGWPGAFLAQRYFRHKTQKVSFQIVFWLIVAFHLGFLGLLIANKMS